GGGGGGPASPGLRQHRSGQAEAGRVIRREIDPMRDANEPLANMGRLLADRSAAGKGCDPSRPHKGKDPSGGNTSPARASASRARALSSSMWRTRSSTLSKRCSCRIQLMKATSITAPQKSSEKY